MFIYSKNIQYIQSCIAIWKELPAEDAGTQTDRGTPCMDTIKGQAEQSMLAQMEER